MEPQSQPAQQVSSAPLEQEDLIGRRISAALIDLGLLVGLFIVLALAIGEAETKGGSVSLALGGAGALGYVALVLLYYFALEATIGQTVGKVLLDLRIVRVDGSRPSVAAVGVRTLLRIVDWLPFFYLIGFIAIMATGRRRQRLGDLAAKTGVARSQPARHRSLAFVPVALLLLLIGGGVVYRANNDGEAETTSFTISTTLTLDLSPADKTAEPPPTGAVLFRDDFSTERNSWYVGRGQGITAAYVNGRYRIHTSGAFTISYANDLKRSSHAISISALVRQAGGGEDDELGVACLSIGHPNQGYAFAVGPNGYVVVRRIVRANWKQTFVERYGEDAVKPGGSVNRIRADCFGGGGRTPARLALYANGELIAETDVPRGYEQFDGISVYTYSDEGGTTSLFDDIVVRELRQH